MDKTIFDKCYDKFNVSKRPGRGGQYSYVTANDVTDRMNRVFEGNWCTEVKSQTEDATGAVIIRLRVSVLDPESKMWFHHEGFGGHKDTAAEPGSSFKSAYSKALVNACRRWGVGLYLDEDTGDPAGGETPTAPTAPPTQGLPPAPAKPAGPPVIPPAIPPPLVDRPPVVEELKLQQVPPTAPPGVESIPKVPAPAPMHGAPLSGGPMSKATAPPAIASPPPDVVMSATTETPSVDSISDVQKIAIESMYDMRGYKYADLAQATLGSVPDINTLTHDQAVTIIQYGNELYKKNKTN